MHRLCSSRFLGGHLILVGFPLFGLVDRRPVVPLLFLAFVDRSPTGALLGVH